MARPQNREQGELARAKKERGAQANSQIAKEVMDRIVANSTSEFQDFLARSGGGDASAGAAQAIGAAPQMSMPTFSAPAPVLNPSFMPPPPAMGGGIVPPVPALNPYGVAPAADPREELLRALGVI